MGEQNGEFGTPTERGALLSDDGLYRYDLWRQWNGGAGRQVLWVMLNPSTADADLDDPTIRRCVSFSSAWGFNRLHVVNLFALRSTDPKALVTAGVDPIGPFNDDHIKYAAEDADLIVCAWGTKGGLLNRAAKVTQSLCAFDLHALDITKEGHPKHPLYVRGDTAPVLYRAGLSGREAET